MRTTPGIVVALLALSFFSSLSQAVIQSRALPIPYGRDPVTNEEVFGECVVVWDDASRTRGPGVLVFPEWWGVNAFTRARAEQLAGMGYVALIVDLYGGGRTTSDPKLAAELSGRLKADRKVVQARAKAALETLKRLRDVDPNRVGAVGYCFGGMAALELARSGADVRAVVSFHGDIAPEGTAAGSTQPSTQPSPAEPASAPTPPPAAPATRPTTAPSGGFTSALAPTFKAKVLVLHGAADPLVPQAAVDAWMAEMDRVGADWVFVAYARAVHAFTNPNAGSDPSKGLAYNADADRRSLAAMQAFFEEALR